MAETAQAEAGTAALSTDIKVEHDPHGFEGLDFNMSPELATKRPFDAAAEDSHDSEAKRLKTELQNGGEEEESFEDGLALLVQNALSNVSDLVDQFGADNDAVAGSSDPMDIDAGTVLEQFTAPIAFSLDPEKYVRKANMHALGTLSLSLLLVLLQQPSDETLKLIHNVGSEHGSSYRKLKLSFEKTKEIYSASPALSADEFEIHDIESRNIIELANLAQLGSWLVDGGIVSLADADANFLSLLQYQLADLPEGMSGLYLAIKTQKAIESLVAEHPERGADVVLEESLTQGLREQLLLHHGGLESNAAEESFVSLAQARKESLQDDLQIQSDPATLRIKYPAEDLLRTFGTYAKSRVTAASHLADKFGLTIHLYEEAVELEPLPDDTGTADLDLDDLSSFFEKTASGLVQNALAGLTEEEQTTAPPTEMEPPAEEPTNGEPKPASSANNANGKIDFMTDYKELEALVAESTSNYVKTTLHGLSPVPYQPTVPTSTTESVVAQIPYLSHLQHHQSQHPYYSYTQQVPEPPAQPAEPGQNLPPNQTFPSAILYDKARQAALSKSSAHTRREGLHSTRRPWTQEEEKALMAGLDMVKGPHWSQILTLFGQSGTISDILKDRTQVQLKDKARNLKLFFLKTNSEMPYYLQAVTGELKTRAPTQAARKEAEERARLNSEEDQAKLQGIMALAGGLQHPPQNRASGSPAVGSGVVTPAQAASVAQAASSGQHMGHAGTAASLMSRTPSISMAQARPGMQATSQQVMQSMPHPPARPQSQLPQQYQRPQSQPNQHAQPHTQTHAQIQQLQQPSYQPQAQTQTHQHAQHLQQQQAQQPTQQQQQQQHQYGAPTQSPSALPQSAPHSQPPTPPIPGGQPQNPRQSPATPTTSTPAQPQEAQHSPYTSVPISQPSQLPAALSHAQAPRADPSHEAVVSQEADQHNDNAAEAALLEGLQAAVAQAIS